MVSDMTTTQTRSDLTRKDAVAEVVAGAVAVYNRLRVHV